MSFTPKFPWFPNIEMYIPRTSLLNHIKRSTSYYKGKLLDVGCGVMPYKELIKKNGDIDEYIGMDLPNSEVYSTSQPDLYWDGYNIPLENSTIDSVLLTEVLEHCPEPQKVLRDINRVLKPNGVVVFSVPFIWYLHESPWDFYRYTPYAIEKMFKDTGYTLPVLETYGSSDLAFLHFYFIWLKKSSFPKFLRFGIYLLSLPFILLCLAFKSQKNNSSFNDGQMFIGIVGIAKKI